MRNIDDITLYELLPQRPPFVMIDRLISSDATFTVTQLQVRADNLFFAEGRLTASGLVENIAQTCAARMGYINLNSGKTVKIGHHRLGCGNQPSAFSIDVGNHRGLYLML